VRGDERYQQDFGHMPGTSCGAPSPSFRDGPAREPACMRWWAPVLTIAGFAAVFVVLVILVGT
jgi:hypothetical protein